MSVVEARTSGVCSRCEIVEIGPFCPVHGDVHRPFTISGRYQVDRLLAAAGGAFVFEALDLTTTRQVAIRVAQRGAVVPSEPSRRPATEILDVGRDAALDLTYVVIDRQDLATAVWPDEAIVDAAVTAQATFTGEARPSATLDALERMARPEMIGSYRVLKQLGAGASGRVYLGEHAVIGSKVAIKVLLPDLARQPDVVTRFLQEARASSQIGSPNIPRFHDFGTTLAGQPYAVMEYFDGETLGHRLRRGVLSIAETADIIDQAAAALQMAHDAGLIHRDLKPENLFLVAPAAVPARLRNAHTASMAAQAAPRLEVKLLDFGIAKVVGRRSAAQTQTGAFLGTPFYCAPEQVFGGEVDARTDVYSLGATAYEMLTGAPPFTGEVPEILSAKSFEEPPDPRAHGLPEVVAETLELMLARDPRLRAPSMAWVRAQVARWTRPGMAESIPPSDDAWPSHRAGHGAGRGAVERLGRAETEASLDESADALGPARPAWTMSEGVERAPRRRGRAVIAAVGAAAVIAAIVVALGLAARKPASRAVPVPASATAPSPPVVPPAPVVPPVPVVPPAAAPPPAAVEPASPAAVVEPAPAAATAPPPHRPRPVVTRRAPSDKPVARPVEKTDVLLVDPYPGGH